MKSQYPCPPGYHWLCRTHIIDAGDYYYNAKLNSKFRVTENIIGRQITAPQNPGKTGFGFIRKNSDFYVRHERHSLQNRHNIRFVSKETNRIY